MENTRSFHVDDLVAPSTFTACLKGELAPFCLFSRRLKVIYDLGRLAFLPKPWELWVSSRTLKFSNINLPEECLGISVQVIAIMWSELLAVTSCMTSWYHDQCTEQISLYITQERMTSSLNIAVIHSVKEWGHRRPVNISEPPVALSSLRESMPDFFFFYFPKTHSRCRLKTHPLLQQVTVKSGLCLFCL